MVVAEVAVAELLVPAAAEAAGDTVLAHSVAEAAADAVIAVPTGAGAAERAAEVGMGMPEVSNGGTRRGEGCLWAVRGLGMGGGAAAAEAGRMPGFAIRGGRDGGPDCPGRGLRGLCRRAGIGLGAGASLAFGTGVVESRGLSTREAADEAPVWTPTLLIACPDCRFLSGVAAGRLDCDGAGVAPHSPRGPRPPPMLPLLGGSCAAGRLGSSVVE